MPLLLFMIFITLLMIAIDIGKIANHLRDIKDLQYKNDRLKREIISK